MEYWKEIVAIAGGILVFWRLVDMGRKLVTKDELKDHCAHQMELVKANTKVAVLEAMNTWLKENGRRLKN